MPPRQDQQLEKCIDEALKKNEFQGLEELLADESIEGTTQKCSKQLLNKLDKLLNRELDKKCVKNASQLLSCLYKFGKSLSIQGSEGMTVLIKQGLVKKWYEKAREMWVEAGQLKNEALMNLAEDFFDSLMVVHENSNEGKRQVGEAFLHHTGQLTGDTRVHITIQQEAARKLNQILDEIPQELKKQMLMSEEDLGVMNILAKRIMDGGDYDLQIAVTEALCRMTTEKHRHQLADQWFTMEFVASAFKGIKDSKFETDCRKFLNLVNGMQGDKRRVYSYPCLEVFLDKHELLMPADDKLEEFWIDFNLGSQSISFYVSPTDEEEENQWDTVCIPENEVLNYTVEEKNGKKILKVYFKQTLNVSDRQGSQIHIHFSASLDIHGAVRHVYGDEKNKEFAGKCRSSVVKTTVQIIFDEGGSQVLVPESQVSVALSLDEKPRGKAKKSSQLPTLSSVPAEILQAARVTQAAPHPVQASTPVRRKVSEASSIVSSSGGRWTTASPVSKAMVSATPALKGKVKPTLELVGSSKKNRSYTISELMATTYSTSVVSVQSGREAGVLGRDKSNTAAVLKDKQGSESRKEIRPRSGAQEFHKKIHLTKVVEMVQGEQKDHRASDEEHLDDPKNIVPDSQPVMRKDRRLLPGLLSSVSRVKSAVSRKRYAVSEGVSTVLNRQERTSSTVDVLNQGQSEQPVLSSAQRSRANDKVLQEQVTEKLEKFLKEKIQRARSPEGTGALGQEEKPAQRGTRRRGKTAQPQEAKEHLSTEIPNRPAPASPAKPLNRTLPVSDNSPYTFGKDYSFCREVCPQKVQGRPMAAPNSEAQQRTLPVAKGPVEKMMRTISRKYTAQRGPSLDTCAQNRSHLEKSWSFSFTEKGFTGSSGFMKSSSHTMQVKKTAVPEDDIYSFRDESAVSFEKKVTKLSNLSVRKESEIEDSRRKVMPLKKSGAKKPGRRAVKKHLFSDTEPDSRPEDSCTNISWLRDSSRRPKPKVADYSRRRAGKPTPNPDSHVSPDLSSPLPKPSKKKASSTKKRERKQTSPKEQRATTSGRPKRTAAQKQTYKDPSGSDSSENSLDEELPLRKPKQVQPNSKEEETVGAPPPVEKRSRGQKNPAADTWASDFSPPASPPPTVEKMRCAEMKSVVSPRSPVSALCNLSVSFTDSPSPPPQLLEPLQGILSQSFYKADQKSLKAPFLLSLSPVTKLSNLAIHEHDKASPALTLISEPPLTSTAIEMCVGEGTENGQMAEEEAEAVEEREDSQDVLVSFDKESVLSVGTQNRSSGKSLSGKKTPRYGTTATQKVHMSGFSGTPSDTLKRLHANQGTSSSEDEDEEESNWKEQEPRMTPRKLFKPSRPDWRAEMAPMAATVKQPPHREEKASSCEEAEEEEWGERVEVPSRSKNLFRKPGLDGTGDNDIEVHSSISSHVVSTLDLNSWESSTEQDMTMMCQKFSTELKRKFQNRSRKMDSYTKQSLKSIQQHVSSVRGQVQQYRFNRLESFRGTIIEELNDFEKDVLALKNMEKELTDFWKKQSQTLSTYQKKEQRRIENLKSSFEQNACHSLEYEERLVTTEMHLMKRDMKLIQEQLFKEMQEEEFLSVRRGLQSLLLPKGRKF